MSDPTTSPVTVLPDGSAFFVASFPLPKDHWIYEDRGDPPPPALSQMRGDTRIELANKVRAAARYAIRAATMSGKEMDFDPDALIQNLIIGLMGTWNTVDYIKDRDQ